LVDCASFVRAHTGRKDVLQYSDDDERWVVLGLAERRMFLSWGSTFGGLSARYQGEVRRRREMIDDLKRAATESDLRERAAAMGVRWYLMDPDDQVAWPKEYRDHPAFESGGFRVYDLSQPPSRVRRGAPGNEFARR
jgi:hypothetical protein